MKKDSTYLKKYWTYLKAHRWTLLIALSLIPMLAIVNIIQPLLIKRGIDLNVLQNDAHGLSLTATIFASCVAIEYGLKALQSYLFAYIGQNTVSKIRADLFWHLSTLSTSYFDKTPLGTLTSRLTSDIEALNESFASGLVTLLSDLLSLIAIFSIMLYLSPSLTLMTIIVLPPLAFVVNIFRLQLRKYFNLTRSLIGQITATLQEQLQGVAVTQLFQREEKTLKEFNEKNTHYQNAVIHSVIYDSLLYSLMESISSIVIALSILKAWNLIDTNTITLGLVIAFIEYNRRFFTPLKEISNKFAILQHALAALEKIFTTFDINDRIEGGAKTLEKAAKTLSIQNVSFAYPGHEEKRILNDISFDLNPGEVVAIVGPTGSGKSTVNRLILQLYDTYTGHIKIDNQNSKDLKLDSLRKQFATVTQDIQLFSEDIYFNISLGNPAITKDAIIKAAKATQAHDFISTLPQGYDTRLSQRGQELSTGQIQLIGFARALASDAPFLLLDEATASIDTLLENKIQNATETLFKEKSVLVIAHRLSTIQKADKILAMKDGQIIESGSHDELMQKNGFYQSLFQIQFNDQNHDK